MPWIFFQIDQIQNGRLAAIACIDIIMCNIWKIMTDG